MVSPASHSGIMALMAIAVYHRFPITATRDEIALAETYKTALVFAQNPQAAPAWLAQLMATVNQISQDVADLRTKSAEQPAILYNSRAGPNEPLYDPIAYGQGLGYVPLAHPATRDELLRLDRELPHHFNSKSCINSSMIRKPVYCLCGCTWATSNAHQF